MAMVQKAKILRFVRENFHLLIFFLMLAIFLGYALFVAYNLKPGIIPDETAHFTFSKHYMTTWGIPSDVNETYSFGWYIYRNPFLYHWLNGRILNVISFVQPRVSEQSMLISLRVINVIFSIGTVIFSYACSKELFNNKWWQLLPVFLLTNTLMFVFLAGGVNYDNFTNLLSTAGLFFLIRTIKKENFLSNSLAWIGIIGLATLAKYTILPLALAMGIFWLTYTFRRRAELFPIIITNKKSYVLIFIVIMILLSNLFLYGINLIRYQSIRPNCLDILNEEQCDISPFVERRNEYGLDSKLTIRKSISLGYPDPLEYSMITWVKPMLLRSFGIHGHQVYYPEQLFIFYQSLFYWMLTLGSVELFMKKNISFLDISLSLIVFFYTLVLLINTYNSELVYGFKNIVLQGRYIFPVIGPIYIIFTKILKATPSKYLRWAILIFTIGLFIYGGPLTLILKYDTVFSSWFH